VGGVAPDPIVAYGRVYVAPTDGIVRAFDPATGTLLWSYDTGGPMSGVAATAANNLVYPANESGHVVALSPSTAVPSWDVFLPGAECYSPVVGMKGVYLTVGLMLYELNPFFGTTTWSVSFSGASQSPTLASGLLYQPAFQCSIVALDPNTGASI